MRLALVFMALAGAARAEDIIAFTRPGCSPCERFKADYAKHPAMVHPHRLHVMDSRSELGKSYGITTVPTFIKLNGGKESSRKVGYGGADGLKQWADRP